ncbi:MAG: hypothetical protein BGO05_26570 [Rhizobiales bacterium 63-7]|nr:MAG: hypothetical protein BGO05_26570 [Rhizobiales bacterium 63-7]
MWPLGFAVPLVSALDDFVRLKRFRLLPGGDTAAGVASLPVFPPLATLHEPVIGGEETAAEALRTGL